MLSDEMFKKKFFDVLKKTKNVNIKYKEIYDNRRDDYLNKTIISLEKYKNEYIKYSTIENKKYNTKNFKYSYIDEEEKNNIKETLKKILIEQTKEYTNYTTFLNNLN